MKTLNLGILAHVDAGKTSLTERLLHAVGVIDEVGSVDAGSTQTDTLMLERQRGITIKSAVVSFEIGDRTVNLIDTPGHSDFIAEVERVLNVLDGAVLVISAVEGVQAQSRVLMRALQRLRIPTLIFVNKIDRAGADPDRVLREIADRLTPAGIALERVDGAGTRAAVSRPFAAADTGLFLRLVEQLGDHDQTILADWVNDESSVSAARLSDALAEQTGKALVHPVFFGSAITGAGIDHLIDGLKEVLPSVEGDAQASASGTVFKVDRGPAGEKIAYLRLFSGTIRVRDRLEFGTAEPAKVTALSVFGQGSAVSRESATAGQIAKVWGLRTVRIGDRIGTNGPRSAGPQFSRPTLETVVDPRHPADRGALHVALTQLAEQDPLINLRQDELRQEVSVSLYGEVQKEVIEATLATDHGIEISFRETTTIHIERPLGIGAAYEIIGTASNPFLATVGLRVEPAEPGSGVHFGLEVELGSMPPAFFKAVEETVRETLHQGIHGWEVPDCVVIVTHSGYWARQSHSHGTFDASMSSTAGAFRNLTALVLMTALTRAGTEVLEPMHRFELVIPADLLGPVLAALPRVRAVPQETEPCDASYRLTGEVPAAWAHRLQETVPTLTRGEGELLCSFDHFRPVQGPVPSRPRTDHNPLDRQEFLLHVVRRV
ncbi:MAG TPA: translation factor GTPase family protein [Kineosporiaceae bacterium]|nr:translation factor GTPase family protein [Kineosporiaceae bacterium]